MQLTTPVQIKETPIFGADTRFFLIGSCFSDEIAARMRAWGVEVCSNPFGTMYNPLSIRACLDRLLTYNPLPKQGGREGLFTEGELVYRDGLYHSWMHHGSFSHADKETALRRMNEALIAGHKALLEADCIIITLGTAFVYERDGQVVANCHKFPNQEFTRRLLSVDEIVSALSPILSSLITNHSSITTHHPSFITTVSPIRHKGDGLSANSLSKATLRVAVEQLCHGAHMATDSACQPAADQLCSASYFPSFEIFMDELRDYRWYGADMLHPAPQAVDYIWERFRETYFSEEAQQALLMKHKSILRSQHRPLHH